MVTSVSEGVSKTHNSLSKQLLYIQWLIAYIKCQCNLLLNISLLFFIFPFTSGPLFSALKCKLKLSFYFLFWKINEINTISLSFRLQTFSWLVQVGDDSILQFLVVLKSFHIFLSNLTFYQINTIDVKLLKERRERWNGLPDYCWSRKAPIGSLHFMSPPPMLLMSSSHRVSRLNFSLILITYFHKEPQTFSNIFLTLNTQQQSRHLLNASHYYCCLSRGSLTVKWSCYETTSSFALASWMLGLKYVSQNQPCEQHKKFYMQFSCSLLFDLEL